MEKHYKVYLLLSTSITRCSQIPDPPQRTSTGGNSTGVPRPRTPTDDHGAH